MLPPPPTTATTSSTTSGTTAAADSGDIDVDVVESKYQSLVRKNMSEDMITRFSVVFSAWRQGGYNQTIERSLLDIEEKLSAGEVGEAERVFEVVSADWSSVIGPANILLIKKLINSVRDNQRDDDPGAAVTKPL